MKTIFPLFLLCFSIAAQADVAKVLGKGHISDVPDDAQICFLGVEGDRAMISCDNKIRIEQLEDAQTTSRGSQMSTYAFLLAKKNFALKSCTSISNVHVNYCIFQK